MRRGGSALEAARGSAEHPIERSPAARDGVSQLLLLEKCLVAAREGLLPRQLRLELLDEERVGAALSLGLGHLGRQQLRVQRERVVARCLSHLVAQALLLRVRVRARGELAAVLVALGLAPAPGACEQKGRAKVCSGERRLPAGSSTKRRAGPRTALGPARHHEEARGLPRAGPGRDVRGGPGVGALVRRSAWHKTHLPWPTCSARPWSCPSCPSRLREERERER